METTANHIKCVFAQLNDSNNNNNIRIELVIISNDDKGANTHTHTNIQLSQRFVRTARTLAHTHLRMYVCLISV